MSWFADAVERMTDNYSTKAIITIVVVLGITGGLCVCAIVNWLAMLA